MPYGTRKRKGKTQVYNKKTGRVLSKGTSKRKAKKQIRLVNAIKHGFKPRKKR